ncbi:unnamed protein product [Owenia fusiformis]|uniref:Fibrinogen C-terminal domain-containing protein n=1 Tax=Owenia fusiformis TaxID=6347 RepID=A0A8S4NSP4_OWEFU|nr:unnamed protein product [Owenia fusiformis]
MSSDVVDLLNRDPKSINAHLQGVAFDECIAEPDAAHSMDCIWSNSYKCFECGKGLCYKLLTCMCGICIALYWGCTFGIIAFEHVWCITPNLKVLDINCNICQRLYACHSIRLGKKQSGGGGQGIVQGVIQAEFGNLKEAIQLLIESQAALKTDLKEDSTSLRDEVSNLRDDVSNLRDDLSTLRDGESDKISSIRDELFNLRVDESDVRDNLVELKESMLEMRRQYSELSINDNTEKADTDDTETNVPLFVSEVCNKSSTMFQEIKDQLKGCQHDVLSTESDTSVLVKSEVCKMCNKSSRMFEAIQEQIKSFRHNSLETTENGKCNESITGIETLKEDLEMMIQEQMKKIVKTCQAGSDDQTNPELRNNVTISVAEDCSGQSDGVHIITTRTGKRFLARCESGWLILAHRFDGSVEFNLEWASYRQGFGNILREHFIGMDNIVSVLQQKRYKARFDLTTWENETRYAEYMTFDINDEKDKYRLNIDGYSGTAGDSMLNNNHGQFSTKDSDNDDYSESCAVYYRGPFWWRACGPQGSVFGIYSKSSKCTEPYDCITWHYWPEKLPGVVNNSYYSFKKVKLKIRPI